MAVSFSTADVEDIDRPLSALFRRMSTNMRTRAVSMVHRMQAVLWVFMKRFRRLFNFKAATWADSKAAYTAETIATMPAGQYLGHLGSYLRRIPQGMVRRVLFGEMNGWLLRFRNENLEGIYRGARIQGSHRSVLVAISMGIAASVSTLIAAVFHVWGSMTAEQLRTFWTWDGLFAADGFAVVWTVVGGSLQLLALFWTWAGAEAERRIPNPHDALMELTRRPPEWTPREGPRPQPEDSLRSRSWQVPLFRALTLLCAAPGFTLLQTSVLLLAGLDHRGYVAATAQLVAFFTLTIPTPGGAFFGEAQCLLGWGLVGVSLGWSAAFGKVDAYEGMQAFLLSSVSVITSVINKQVVVSTRTRSDELTAIFAPGGT